jgi:dihydrofolate reductase
MIAAMAQNRVIGKDNDMPWHMPADLKHFRRITLGKPVVMGRKTYESIGRPLPGRTNFVLSRDPNLAIEGVVVVPSFERAIELAGNVEELMVIGGGNIYHSCLPLADRLYLTQIELEVEGDTRFPDYTVYDWDEVSRESYSIDADNAHAYHFIQLDRIR